MENYIARTYGTAIAQETFGAHCLRGKNGEVMTKMAKAKMQLYIVFAVAAAIINLLGIIYFFLNLEEMNQMGNKKHTYLACLSFLVLSYIFLLIWFRLRRYTKYYLREEGLVKKRGISEKLILYHELVPYISQWKPVIGRRKIYFVTKQGLVTVEYGNMVSGVCFVLELLRKLGEDTITTQDFSIMYYSGNWKKKRKARKEIKKRKRYIKKGVK